MGSNEPRVFFPWERKGVAFGVFGRGRVKLVAVVVCLSAFALLIHRREEHAAAVRATRASLTTAYRAVDGYRADHSGACPQRLSDLVAGGYTRGIPADAWGHPLRLQCPGRIDAEGFDLSSDGPDGLPGGLDRVE